jgi:aminoglycoside 3-N-acetyltransferase I
MSSSFDIRLLAADDVELLRALSAVFGAAFEEPETYTGAPPGREYLRRLLASDTFLALVARKGGEVVGGAAAYELRKFERERSEIYLYDLAVASPHRRQGIATALVRALQELAATRGAHVVFVQADAGDAPAIALYSKLGTREEVLHFDVPVGGGRRGPA